MLLTRLSRLPDAWLLSHAHTLVELRRARRPLPYDIRRVVPFAVEVVLQSVVLS